MTPATLEMGLAPLAVEVRRMLAGVVGRRPLVHCITNTVVQGFTANILLAIGAEPAMATHPDEVPLFAGQADAILVNLGTLDASRQLAIDRLVAAPRDALGPLVVDPVMVDRSALRQDLALRLLALPRVILKGNAREMATLAPHVAPGVTRVTTGAVDEVRGGSGQYLLPSGHPLLARVTGTGCAVGAVIAAFAAVEPDPVKAACAALTLFGRAAERAAARSAGPGGFAVHLIDALAFFADHSQGEAHEA